MSPKAPWVAWKNQAAIVSSNLWRKPRLLDVDIDRASKKIGMTIVESKQD